MKICAKVQKSLVFGTLVLWGSVIASPFELDNLSVQQSQSDGSHYQVPYFPSAMNDRYGREGIMQIVNLTDQSGTVTINAYDEAGNAATEIELSILGGNSLSVSSSDIESGNDALGISKGIDAPDEGDWRLEVNADIAIQVVASVRTFGGFSTSMHDVVPLIDDVYPIYFFRGSHRWPIESRLRLINLSNEAVDISIRGRDDDGEPAPNGVVTMSLRAGQTAKYTARDLEKGHASFDGSFGTIDGDWHLEVDASTPILVLNLLHAPTGHVTNLSTIPGEVDSTYTAPPPVVPSTKPDAPTIEVVDARNFVIRWTHMASAGKSYAFDTQAKFDTDAVWADLLCDVVEYENDVTDDLSLPVPLTADLVAGEVIQARYRVKESDACATGTWGLWSEVGEVTVEGDDDDGGTTQGTRYGVGETIANMPSGFFGGTLRGVSMRLSGGVVTITFDNGGYVENNDYRWTCDASDGCRVVDRVVEEGEIVETEA